MTQLSTNPIQQADINEYLNSSADFGFEMKVLSVLKAKGFACQHSGTYTDPITGKSRQFDIRCEKDIGRWRVRLAVECKNLRDNYPLIVHSVPRQVNEAWHSIILHKNEHLPADTTRVVEATDTETPFQAVRVTGQKTLYKPGIPLQPPQYTFVAKAIDQVGRSQSGNKIITGDEQVFDKVSQATNSSRDLIVQAHSGVFEGASIILPILVVPANTLWEAKYDKNGNLQGTGSQIKQASYFIDKEWSVDEGRNQAYRISHLEICTFDNLGTFLDDYFCGDIPSMIFNP